HDYFPYGEDTTPTPNNRLKFTGRLRDHESGLDYFGARYYGSALGRFVSPDAVRNDSHPGNPQSWNRYAYGRNNPLRFFDPTGEAVVAYDANGNLLCKDLDCNFYKKGNLTVGDKTYTPDQYTVRDPNPSAVVYDKPEPHELSSFAIGVFQGLDARRQASLQIIGGVAGVSVAGGVIGAGIGAIGGGTGSALFAAASVQGGSLARTVLNISTHAAKQMADRGVTKKMVEVALTRGAKFWDPKNNAVNYVLKGGFASGKDLLVGQNPTTGVITTVIRGTNISTARMAPLP
ncbi:MAG: hypothetical protein HY232_16650, partial [Acidobacteria bacterium]|nr:hypothetical protein [Acidobacteriota bacterium]